MTSELKIPSVYLRRIVDAYRGEIACGRAPEVALNYAAAIYLQSHPCAPVGETRTLIRAAVTVAGRPTRSQS